MDEEVSHRASGKFSRMFDCRYMWGGYGSGIINNLRDAVLAAEDFFGDLLPNAVDLIKNFGEIHRMVDKSSDDCKFTCPSGETPVKNKFHKPSSNGCGTDLLKMKINKYIPALDMTECCNQHDICYDTCNNVKQRCDEDFKKCLYNVCDSLTKIDTLSKTCKVAASAVSGSLTLGCNSYLESQKKSCYCSSKGKKKKNIYVGEL